MVSIADLDHINKLVKDRERAVAAIQETIQFITYREDNPQPGLFITSYSDGSGSTINLSRLGIEKELAEKALEVLESKLSRINKELMDFGITGV